MSARLDLVGASVQPFQFPPLRDDPPAGENVTNGEVHTLANGAASLTPDSEAPVAEPPPDAVVLEAERAASHAEGLRLGLEEGRTTGYEAGFAEGRKAGEATLAEAARRLIGLAATLGGPIAVLDQPVEETVVALALEVARCVIGGEVKRSHEFLVRLVRQAIAKVPLEMGTPRVLLNPADLDLVRQLVSGTDLGSAVLVGDEAIEAGGCLVVADGEDQPIMDRRWNTRAVDGASQVNLTLSSRWREVMLTMFDGEDE